MKERIKIDSAILSCIIILTGFLYKFPHLYPNDFASDDRLDFIGLFVVLTGTFLRMAARGHKKAHSQKGEGLVTTGPYSLTRNPMYLGSFLTGAGFTLIVWPWWGVVIFSYLFYLRFDLQIKKEEEHLRTLFGKAFAVYVDRVPRIFPRWDDLREINFKKVFPYADIWSTKEKRGLVSWPLLAILMESFQEQLVFGFTNLSKTITIFVLSELIFGAMIWSFYRKSDEA